MSDQARQAESGDGPTDQHTQDSEDLKELAQLRSACERFRVLVIGKANAGKTTVLQRVCGAKNKEVPTVRDENGIEVGLPVATGGF
jgi:GTPase SAR1 family protein